MIAIAGKYDFVSTENYEDWLKAMGAGLVTRNIAARIKAQLEYIDHGNGKWTQKTTSTFKNLEITFTVGQEFVEELADGRKSNTIVTLDGATFVQKQTLPDGVVSITTREFKDNGDLVCTFKAKDAVAVRCYKKM